MQKYLCNFWKVFPPSQKRDFCLPPLPILLPYSQDAGGLLSNLSWRCVLSFLYCSKRHQGLLAILLFPVIIFLSLWSPWVAVFFTVWKCHTGNIRSWSFQNFMETWQAQEYVGAWNAHWTKGHNVHFILLPLWELQQNILSLAKEISQAESSPSDGIRAE